jgi:glycerate kinase
MRLLVAPNAFKGTFSAPEAARAIARGLARSLPHATIDLMPLADGGPGTLSCFEGQSRRARVKNALGGTVSARWLVQGKLALIESSQAIGLTLIPKDKLKPLDADSYGLGQLILAARKSGANRLVIGLGGSATSDGGSGMARALGWRFMDKEGRELKPGGGHLVDLHRLIAPLKPRHKLEIQVLCDVDNPLFGSHGAAFVYAPQKGARASEVRRLDQGLRKLAGFFPPGLPDKAGAGAAGGLGFGLMAFCGARLSPGAETLLKLNGFDARLARAEAVASGEGRLDRQSLSGKLPVVVARRALKAGKACALFCGSVERGLSLPGVRLLALNGKTLADQASTWGKELAATP